MADFTAITDVSRTLVDLLAEGLSHLGTAVKLDDLQKPPAAANLLTLFLFQIREDGHSRNRPPEVRVTGAQATIQKPPLALSLQFLLTPWTAKHEDNQNILGQVMQTLHDHAIISGPALKGSLAAGNEALHVSLLTLTLEDQLRVWNGLDKAYRLSLYYEVRVVRIQSLSMTERSTVRSRGIAPATPAPEVPR